MPFWRQGTGEGETPHRLVSNARQNENRVPSNRGGITMESKISGY